MPEALHFVLVLSVFEILSISILDDPDNASLVGSKESLVSGLLHEVGKGNGAEAKGLEVSNQDVQSEVQAVLGGQVGAVLLRVDEALGGFQVFLDLLEESVGQIGGIGVLEEAHHVLFSLVGGLALGLQVVQSTPEVVASLVNESHYQYSLVVREVFSYVLDSCRFSVVFNEDGSGHVFHDPLDQVELARVCSGINLLFGFSKSKGFEVVDPFVKVVLGKS